MRSPIKRFGGKGNMIPKLLPLIPDHQYYCEPFFGAGSLFFAKRPASVETINDLDSAVADFFRVLADEELFPRFLRKAQATPYSRELFNEFRETWRDETDRVERAWRWFLVARQSFNGDMEGGWSFSRSLSGRGIAGACHSWLSAIDGLPAIHERLMQTQIECADFREVIRNYDTPVTFFYLDPPYVASTRSKGGYEHEMTDADHAELVELLLGVEGKVLLSGYRNETYAPLNDWQTIAWKTVCHAAGRTRGTGILGEGAALEKQARVETVWMNYDPDARQGRLFCY